MFVTHGIPLQVRKTLNIRVSTRHNIANPNPKTLHIALTAGNVDFSGFVNVVLFSRIDVAKVYITTQHPSLCGHAAKYMLFTLASTQMSFIVVGCDGGEIPTSGPSMACEWIVVCLCTVV